jgi:hypothetical protein
MNNLLAGIEAVAAKGETELNAILVQVTALQVSLAAVGTASPVMASLAANLLIAEAFLKMAVTDTTPFVTALENAVALLNPAK